VLVLVIVTIENTMIPYNIIYISFRMFSALKSILQFGHIRFSISINKIFTTIATVHSCIATNSEHPYIIMITKAINPLKKPVINHSRDFVLASRNRILKQVNELLKNQCASNNISYQLHKGCKNYLHHGKIKKKVVYMLLIIF